MNMCKNIHKSIASSLAAAALLLGSAGCNDFLNVVPDDGLPSIETAFNLRSSAIRYLATCYSYMTLEGSMGNDPAMLGSDEYWDLYGRTTTNTTGRVPFTMSYIARGNMTANSVFANDWAEMYKVFNMGHRLEVYLSPEHAEEVIAISESFGIPAQIVGRIEESDQKELIIKSEFGEFKY